MANASEALQDYYFRTKLPVGALTTAATYNAFGEFKLGGTGAGFGSDLLTEVETNWEGEVKAEGFVLEGIAIGIIHDSLKSAENANDTYEFLTKVAIILKLEGGREINLGRAYNWPQVHGVAINHIPGGTPGGVDHSIGANGVGVPTKMLAEPIPLKKGSTLRLIYKYNTADVPTFVAQQFVDARLICRGRYAVN